MMTGRMVPILRERENEMAVFEMKIMQVKNDEYVINNINNAMACFGWAVLSVQITHSRNTQTYSSAWNQIGGNQLRTVETATINYATITYQRSKGLTNYQKIVELEREFEQIMQQIDYTQAELDKEENIGCITIIIWPLLLYKIYKMFNRKPNMSQYTDKIRSLEEKRDAILQQAEALLD